MWPETGVITVSDESLTVTATFERAALEPRTAFHPTWSFVRGELVVIRWSHPSDLIGTGAGVSLGTIVPVNPVSIQPPDSITFMLAPDYPTGPKSASVYIGADGPDLALECTNAFICEARQVRSYTHDADVR